MRRLFLAGLTVTLSGCVLYDWIEAHTLPPVTEQSCGTVYAIEGDTGTIACESVEEHRCASMSECDDICAAVGCIVEIAGHCTIFYVDEWARRHELCHIEG